MDCKWGILPDKSRILFDYFKWHALRKALSTSKSMLAYNGSWRCAHQTASGPRHCIPSNDCRLRTHLQGRQLKQRQSRGKQHFWSDWLEKSKDASYGCFLLIYLSGNENDSIWMCDVMILPHGQCCITSAAAWKALKTVPCLMCIALQQKILAADCT